MKKTLGLLALTLAVSSVASADQDFLKKISLDVKGVYNYQDSDVKIVDGKGVEELKRVGIGNEGFKKENKLENEFKKKLEGTLVLDHANGVEADFYVEHNDKTDRRASVPAGLSVEGRALTVKYGVKFRKDVKVKGLNTSWYAKYDGSKEKKYNADREYVDKSRKSTNKFELGTSYSPLSYLDMKHAVNYEVRKSNDVLTLLTEANFKKEGEIAKVPGKLSYNFNFNHKFSHIASKLDKEEGKKARRSNLELEYVQGLKYEAPKFLGMSLTSSLENKFTRETNVTGWSYEGNQNVKLASPSVFGFEGSIALDNTFKRSLRKHKDVVNTFKVPVELSYSHTFKTVAGDLMVRPYASYDVLVRESKYNKNNKDNKRITTEKNEAVLGLKVSLNVK